MGWGTGSWGPSAWGIGAPLGDLGIIGARATSPRSVLVTVSREPVAVSSIAAGDALNPLTWTVTRLDTLATFTILSVARRSSTTFEILTLQKFSAFPWTMRVESGALETSAGLVIASPTSFDFYGMELSVADAGDADETRDLENPPFDLQTHVGGTLRVDSSGDYVNQSGREFLRKLVYRRLTTTQGSFFHLPDYGLGIRLKEPMRNADLNKVRAAIELQLLREPEFATVRVQLTINSGGVLTILVRAILSQTNQEIALTVEAPQGGVEL